MNGDKARVRSDRGEASSCLVWVKKTSHSRQDSWKCSNTLTDHEPAPEIMYNGLFHSYLHSHSRFLIILISMPTTAPCPHPRSLTCPHLHLHPAPVFAPTITLRASVDLHVPIQFTSNPRPSITSHSHPLSRRFLISVVFHPGARITSNATHYQFCFHPLTSTPTTTSLPSPTPLHNPTHMPTPRHKRKENWR